MAPTPKIAGATISGGLAVLITHLLLWAGVAVPSYLTDYLPLVLALLGGYLTPELRRIETMATVKELEAFLKANVPDGLVEAVFEKLRDLGGDSEDSASVATALDAVQNPAEPVEDSSAPVAVEPTSETLTKTMPSPEFNLNDFIQAVEPVLSSALGPIAQTVAQLTTDLEALTRRVTDVEQATTVSVPADIPVTDGTVIVTDPPAGASS